MGDGLFIELNIALMPAQPLADELASTSQAIAKKRLTRQQQPPCEITGYWA